MTAASWGDTWHSGAEDAVTATTLSYSAVSGNAPRRLNWKDTNCNHHRCDEPCALLSDADGAAEHTDEIS